MEAGFDAYSRGSLGTAGQEFQTAEGHFETADEAIRDISSQGITNVSTEEAATIVSTSQDTIALAIEAAGEASGVVQNV